MKKLILGLVLMSAGAAFALTAKTVSSMWVSHTEALLLPEGSQIIMSFIVGGKTTTFVNYTVPAGKTLNGGASLQGELK